MRNSPHTSYSDAGVDTDREVTAVQAMSRWLLKTFDFRPEHRPRLGLDYFANVVQVTPDLGIAVSTDGVGTKVLIAQQMRKYDTIGIDCVAMNVNDVLCVGADPVAMVDYMAIQREPDPGIAEEIAKGLYTGAELAQISIPGGETAQLPDIIKGESGGYGMDLVGTCIGTVPLNRIITGRELEDGDILLGLRSSGVHSNGLTLARKVFLERLRLDVDTYVPDIGRALGDELLEPTRIYAAEVRALLARFRIKALVNITSDGFLNLARVYNDVSFIIEALPPAQPIFRMLADAGNVPLEEMYRVYNMGIGFCVVVPKSECEAAIEVLAGLGSDAQRIGRVAADGRRRVDIQPVRLMGENGRFYRY